MLVEKLIAQFMKFGVVGVIAFCIDYGLLIFCTEVLHMYLARDLRHGAQHPDEDEFLELCRTPFSQLLERAMNGELQDAKTVALLLKVNELLRRENHE